MTTSTRAARRARNQRARAGLPLLDRTWHVAYSQWYDHREAGNPRRSALWGAIADGLVRILWATHRA